MATRRQIKFSIHRPPAAAALDLPAALREGQALFQAGKLARAEARFRSVLEADPRQFDALHLLGVIAARKGQPAEADKLISQALALKPAEAAAYANRGLARRSAGQYEAALADFDRAIALKPASVENHYCRGNVLFDLKRYSSAATSYGRAIALRPGFADARSNRANVLLSLGRHHDPVAIDPKHAESHGNRSNALQHLGRYEEALAIRPGYSLARANRSNLCLLTGRFAQGWQHFETRWDKWLRSSSQRTLLPSRFTQPQWDGRPTPSTLLLWPEQGIGDQILYSSMFNEARARVGRMIVATDDRLQTLFARAFPDCEVTTISSSLRQQRFDLQLPMGSLGRYLRDSAADFPRKRKAFLIADGERSAALRKTIAPGRKRICGLSWRSTNAEFGEHKSMALPALQPLLQRRGLRFAMPATSSSPSATPRRTWRVRWAKRYT